MKGDSGDSKQRGKISVYRKAQGRGPGAGSGTAEAVQTYLRAHPRGPLPEWRRSGGAHRARGIVQSTTGRRPNRRAGGCSTLPPANKLPVAGVVGRRCTWTGGAGLALERGAPARDQQRGPGGRHRHLRRHRETGTLMLCRGRTHPHPPACCETPSRPQAGRIVAHGGLDLPPRLASCAPSTSFQPRTGDIEQQLVLAPEPTACIS